MPGPQRIFVVSSTAEQSGPPPLLRDLGRRPVVLAAPTLESERIVRPLGVEPEVDVLLAPVRFPQADRGHRLDELVRRHALRDRFRDVVVVTDQATATLLLRVLAPDQLPGGGPVTVVGLPRGDRPVAVRRAVISGVVLGIAAAVAPPAVPMLAVLAGATSGGVMLLAVAPVRHLARELLLTVAVCAAVMLVLVAGAARFPAGW